MIKPPKLRLSEVTALRCKPVHLLVRRGDVAVEVQLALQVGDGTVGGFGQVPLDGVAPAHEGDLLVEVEGCGVGLVDVDGGCKGHRLGSDGRVLGMLGARVVSRCVGTAVDCGQRRLARYNGGVSRRNRVDQFLVHCPQKCPVHEDDISTRALLEHELAQGVHGEATAEDASNGRHSRVVPSAHLARVDNLEQLSLGEKCSDEG